jgi:hypothetical protein
VKKKPQKDRVEEAQAAYDTQRGRAESAVRYADLAKVKKSNAELMKIHREVLRKLAQ